MAKDPAVLFYTADFLVGTYGFSMQERGEYITLLCLQHQQGHLSEDTVRSIASSASVIDKFLRDPHGRYYNERLDQEKIKRENFNKKQYLNGIKGGRPKKPKQNPRVSFGLSQKKPKQNPGENENENNNKALDLSNTLDKVLNLDQSNTSFPFSIDDDNDDLLSTNTTRNYYSLYRENEDENGLIPEELEAIGEFLAAHFDDLPLAKVIDIQNDFIAYNKSKGWRGIGGEDVRQDLKRYLRRWIDEERAKRSKYQRS